MTVLTKADLQDWKANPVTRAISKLLTEQVEVVKSESSLRDTCDQTAMQVARNEGVIEGIEALNIAFEDLSETMEGAE